MGILKAIKKEVIDDKEEFKIVCITLIIMIVSVVILSLLY